jgi:hypothetical protein
MNEVQRLFGVIWEPRPVFQDLAARPRFWVPLILLTALSILYVFTFSRVVGWETFMRQQFETNPRVQEMPPEQRQQAMEQGMKFGVAMGYAGSAVGFAVISLVIAGVMLGLFNALAGADLTFRKVFSLVCYAFVPSVIATILALVTMFLKNPEDFDLQNPLILNAGAFLDKSSTPGWLYSIATSLDLFNIWIILLLALGLAVAARKVAFSKSLTLVVSAWVVWVLVKAGWTAAFG